MLEGPINADLHCHSSISDGLLTAAAVVRRAAANGVELLALTDHDDVSGLAEAQRVAAESSVRFVAGVEVSVTWEDATVHVVGLGVDPANPALNAGLTCIREGRVERAGRMAAELEAIGIHGALVGAMRHARNAKIIGRTHFARYLVEQHAAPDVKSVFDHYLARGKPGFVMHRWAALPDALRWILDAGGMAVLAHPGRYRVGRAAMHRLVAEFKDCGGGGVEVVTGAHDAERIRDFAGVARTFGLLASRGSDFHGPGESPFDLGRMSALPDGLVPVWTRLI